MGCLGVVQLIEDQEGEDGVLGVDPVLHCSVWAKWDKIKCDYKIKQVFFISTLREPSVNRKDLRALTLVGPTRDNPEPDPLAVLHLDNRLYITTKCYCIWLSGSHV